MRYLISVVLFVLFTVLLGITGGNANFFIDFPSFIIVGIFPILFVAVLFGFKETIAAFSSPFKKETDKKGLLKAQNFFKTYKKTLWITGLIAVLFSIIAMLGDLTDYSRIGVYFAIILISVLYCSLINLIVIIPFNVLIGEKITDETDN